MSKQYVLVTGANGFIGRGLCPFLKEKGYFVRGAVRNDARDVVGVDEYIQVGDINGSTDWQEALIGVDTVVHLAARVHIMDSRFRGNDNGKGGNDKELEAFRRVNVLGTERLARMAALAGVKRFIFISSVKAGGKDAYGISKQEAEDSLAAVAAETGLKTVILRPSLVYGQGVKANFKNLIKLVGLGLPLPFKGIHNQRSFIYIGNLVDVISICITHPQAVGETFSVSDGEDISTPDLMKMIASSMNKKLILFPLPPAILKGLAALVGQWEAMEKLTGSLCVDCSKIKNLLGWKPPFTLQEGIKETV
jgi:nucleoside-diphosphate-sugar epimerase